MGSWQPSMNILLSAASVTEPSCRMSFSGQSSTMAYTEPSRCVYHTPLVRLSFWCVHGFELQAGSGQGSAGQGRAARLVGSALSSQGWEHLFRYYETCNLRAPTMSRYQESMNARCDDTVFHVLLYACSVCVVAPRTYLTTYLRFSSWKAGCRHLITVGNVDELHQSPSTASAIAMILN